MNGMGSHQSAAMAKDEWITPRHIIDALGEFDLDPCAPIEPPWEIARRTYVRADNGLTRPWEGRVWLNPPYGKHTQAWMNRLAQHGNGIALIFARVETKAFRETVWTQADAILFLEGRLYFHHVCGRMASSNAGAPSCLVAYGEENVRALEGSGLAGALVTYWKDPRGGRRRPLKLL